MNLVYTYGRTEQVSVLIMNVKTNTNIHLMIPLHVFTLNNDEACMFISAKKVTIIE